MTTTTSNIGENHQNKIKIINDAPKNNSRKTIRYICDPKKDVLGSGAFANVYRVRREDDKQEKQYFALKIIDKKTLVTKEDKKRILQEIKIHRNLNNIHICKFEHSFEDKDNIYLLMEYCEKKTLKHLLELRGKLTEIEIRYYMFQVLEALQYLYRKKIVHRDLSLGNLFISEGNIIKIGDFGISYIETDNDEKLNMIYGTTGFYAPETIQTRYSYKSDIFSFGSCIYTLLAGNILFTTAENTYKAIEDDEIPYNKNIECSFDCFNLLQKIFTNENSRIELDEIYEHPFFNKGIDLLDITIPEYPEKNDPKQIEKLKKFTDEIRVLNLKLDIRPKGYFQDYLKDKEKEKKNKNDLLNYQRKTRKYKNMPITIDKNQLLKHQERKYQSSKGNIFNNKLENNKNNDLNLLLRIKSDSFINPKKIKNENNRLSYMQSGTAIKIMKELENNADNIIKEEEELYSNDNKEIKFNPNENIVLQKNNNNFINLLEKEKCKNVETPIFSKNNKINFKESYIQSVIDNCIDVCGIGYQFNNGDIGAFFNDNSQMIKVKENNNFINYYYFDNLKKNKEIEKIKIRENNLSNDILNKKKFLCHIMEIFIKNNKTKKDSVLSQVSFNKSLSNFSLSKNYSRNHRLNYKSNSVNYIPSNERDIHLIKYKKEKNDFYFILSNNTIQVKFHDKINIIFKCDIPRKIVYIDSEGLINTFHLNNKESFIEVNIDDIMINNRIKFSIKCLLK